MTIEGRALIGRIYDEAAHNVCMYNLDSFYHFCRPAREGCVCASEKEREREVYYARGFSVVARGDVSVTLSLAVAGGEADAGINLSG